MGSLPDARVAAQTIPTAEPPFQSFSAGYFYPGTSSDGWVRDWSFRTYNSWNLTALQGHSSLAAAMWATLVDEPNIGSRRWGCGLNKKYFDLGSFEGLHWFCVGAYQFQNAGNLTKVTLTNATGGTFALTVTIGGTAHTTAGLAYNADAPTVQAALEALGPYGGTALAKDVGVTGSPGGPYTITILNVGNLGAAGITGDGSLLTGTGVTFDVSANSTRWAEKYKFDFLLSEYRSAAEFFASDMLMTCQGFRVCSGGVMKVGVNRSGVFPTWHFTEKQMSSESDGSSLKVKFAGRTDAPNMCRVQYRDVLNEYQHNIAFAEDEFDIECRGKTQLVTITAEGCGRFDSADILAKEVLDQSRGGKHYQFSADFRAFLLSPGDVIEITDLQAGVNHELARVAAFTEHGDKRIQIEAVQHRFTRDSLSAPYIAPPTLGSGTQSTDTGDCDRAACPLDGTVNWFNNSATYPAGSITINYLNGTYKPVNDGTWNYDVAGFDVVTRDSGGTIIVLGTAPAVSIAAPGWASQTQAENDNQGETATFTLASAGPVGLRRTPPGSAFQAGSNPPTYELCLT
jgi:hypothetical protein